MWRLRGPVSRLALLPSSAEILIVTLVSHSLLGLPWVGTANYYDI
jgi:NhaP-type Na+/H+ or K+/H+ antiporter